MSRWDTETCANASTTWSGTASSSAWTHEIDPRLEVAEVQRRLYRARGPAVLFTRVKGCAFPILANLFGTPDRARFLFRDTLDAVRRLVRLKIDPREALRRPWRHFGTAVHRAAHAAAIRPPRAGPCARNDGPATPADRQLAG